MVVEATTADGSDTMGACPGDDAARLLRSIDAQQSHGGIGSMVLPFAAARSARVCGQARSATRRLCGP
jgi:hypothetical protein